MRPELTQLAGDLTFEQTFQIECIVPLKERQDNSAYCYSMGLPSVAYRVEALGRVAIVASGPSAKNYLDRLRQWNGEIWAINGAFGWLLSEGIKVSAFVGMDPEPILAEYYLKEIPQDVTYYIANQCHRDVFDRLKDRNVRTWHAMDDGVPVPIGQVPIRGGSTCLGRAPYLACLLGWTDIHLYGGDSSYQEDGTGYAYGGAPPETICFAESNGKRFATNRQFLSQAVEIVEMLKNFPGSITVHGDGLMPEMAREALPGFHKLQRLAKKLSRAA